MNTIINIVIFLLVAVFTLIGKWYTELTVATSFIVLLLLLLYFYVNRKQGLRFSRNPNFGKPVILYYIVQSSLKYVTESLYLSLMFFSIYILIIGWFFMEPQQKKWRIE